MTVSVLQQVQADSAVGGGGGSTSIGIAITTTLGTSLHIAVTVGGGINVAATPLTNTGTALTFTLLDNIDDASNSQRFIHYKVDNCPAQTTTITANFASAAPYVGIMVKEIGGTSGYDAAASAHAGQLQASPGTGANAITSGNTPTLTSQPALFSGFVMSTGVVDTNSIGTGYANDEVGSWWQFDLATNMASSESKRVTVTTGDDATFTAGSSNGSRITLVAAFLESASGGTVNTATLSDTLVVADAGGARGGAWAHPRRFHRGDRGTAHHLDDLRPAVRR